MRRHSRRRSHSPTTPSLPLSLPRHRRGRRVLIHLHTGRPGATRPHRRRRLTARAHEGDAPLRHRRGSGSTHGHTANLARRGGRHRGRGQGFVLVFGGSRSRRRSGGTSRLLLSNDGRFGVHRSLGIGLCRKSTFSQTREESLLGADFGFGVGASGGGESGAGGAEKSFEGELLGWVVGLGAGEAKTDASGGGGSGRGVLEGSALRRQCGEAFGPYEEKSRRRRRERQ